MGPKQNHSTFCNDLNELLDNKGVLDELKLRAGEQEGMLR